MYNGFLLLIIKIIIPLFSFKISSSSLCVTYWIMCSQYLSKELQETPTTSSFTETIFIKVKEPSKLLEKQYTSLVCIDFILGNDIVLIKKNKYFF